METRNMSNELYKLCAEAKAFCQQAAKPLLVLLGPTAGGKTAASIAIAKYLQEQGTTVEIINADSRQLYKHLNIGTAKITEEEKQGIAHHLFDVLDPKEDVTIAWYQEKAKAVIEEIRSRGHVPMLVGGSMLYISVVIDGLELQPSADLDLRKRLEEEYDQDRGASLYKKLQEVDPETAAAFHPNNKLYVVRAMEIFEITKTKPSVSKKKSKSEYDLLILGIEWPREELMKRIDTRTKQMFEAGWIEEVQQLMQRGYTKNDPGMKSHGYKEIMDAIESGSIQEQPINWLLNNQALTADLSRRLTHQKKGRIYSPALAEAIAAKTRQYAKRQTTWWKNDTRIQWIHSEAEDRDLPLR